MIRRLRIKIIAVITLILTFAVFGIMTAVNAMESNSSRAEIESKMRRIADMDGFMPNDFTDLDPFSDSQSGYVDTFSIQIDFAYNVRRIVLTRDITVQQDEIIGYANQALQSGETYGELGRYAYYVQQKGYGTIIVFMNIQSYQQSLKNLRFTTSLIGLLTIFIFFGMSVALSFWLVRPVKTTFDKQKLFISNASHELKTPLAVISANSDVLEAQIGDNKWLGYIKSETLRMSELVEELLCLARLDDKTGHKLVMEEFNLTDVFLQTALPFESKVFELGKRFDVEAQPDLKYKGDVSSIRHVLTILIDNAIKYSEENGQISVKLYAHSGKKIIEVYNTGEGVPKDKLNKIFERFYRQDEARNSKSGGYGLGLAIAKASVEAHGGKIYAQSEYGKWMKFTVSL